MWNRQQIKETGKLSMKRNYWNSVLVAFIASLFAGASAGVGRSVGNSSAYKEEMESSGLSGINFDDPEMIAVLLIILGVIGVIALISFVLKVLIFNPLKVGCNRFFVHNQSENAAAGDVTHAFKTNYAHTVFAMFLSNLVIGLGFLCFLIPGIILTYSYKLVPYILTEEPGLGAVEVLKKSRAMMKGHKWNYFVFELSFLGWYLLSILTCGILALFYVNPYFYNAAGALYIAIRDNYNGYTQGGVVETPAN